MVTTYLQGGLGNQLFQVAAAYNHAKNNNTSSGFDFSNSHSPHQGNNSSKYINTIFKEFNNVKDVYNICNKPFTQPGHSFCNIPFFKNQQLQGYFQSEKFFLENKEEIVNKILKGLMSYEKEWELVTNDINTLKSKHNKPIVSIHIRRGDYLKFLGVHDPCPLSYYNKAMDVMKEIVGDFHPYFISDDISWCIETFNNKGSFSEYENEVCDLMIMVNSDCNIIANSSFSWWGSYLNPSKEKTVIAPKKWFGPAGPQDQQDIIPPNWMKI